MKVIETPDVHTTLDDYARVANLVAATSRLRDAANRATSRLRHRTVWMINSTAAGGGVAELLPGQIALLRDLGLDVRWAVMDVDQPDFFAFTKRLHNLIHGARDAHPGPGDRATYDAVCAANARWLLGRLRPGDIIVVHDPQPAGMVPHLRSGPPVRFVWRSHIGLDESNEHTRAAWQFLATYLAEFHRTVFSLPEYVPESLRERAIVIHPTIDPLSHKNRDLSLHKLVGIGCDAQLVTPHWPLVAPMFAEPAKRLQADGTFAVATTPDDIGLLGRPIVTQISRWDRLKGFGPLLDAFALLKTGGIDAPVTDARHARRLELVRLVLAGPDAAAVQDDPEGREVLGELMHAWAGLPRVARQDVALLALPMGSRKHNSLMVNVLQRASDVVVQNSLREGFGLTVSEAMWKRKAVLGSGRAAGVRRQVRDGIDGMLVPDPEDAQGVGRALHAMLADPDRLEEWGRSAQLRAHDDFLLLGELVHWLDLFADL